VTQRPCSDGKENQVKEIQNSNQENAKQKNVQCFEECREKSPRQLIESQKRRIPAKFSASTKQGEKATTPQVGRTGAIKRVQYFSTKGWVSKVASEGNKTQTCWVRGGGKDPRQCKSLRVADHNESAGQYHANQEGSHGMAPAKVIRVRVLCGEKLLVKVRKPRIGKGRGTRYHLEK